MKPVRLNRFLAAAVFEAFLVFGHVGNLWAPMEPPNVLAEKLPLLKCYQQLQSSDFTVINPQGLRNFTRAREVLTEKIAAMLEWTQKANIRTNRTDEAKLAELRNEYDDGDDAISRGIESGQFILAPGAERILDDCYDAVHPDAPDVE